jgi:ankyrin repeat protein
MMELLRAGDHQAFRMMLSADTRVANLKGPGGSTPLMYAVLHGDADAVRLLLDSGPRPSVKAPGYKGTLTPLSQAAELGDEAVSGC